ncbi:aldo-keto reductase family 1 member B1-like [Haliotis rubra]|uniref:aldo-keto reductase family 1 member B1-like n=1 Tax=Haliotis rubra TaxID=36100 RepID=UPI001EE4FA20|nr:aldo-keto reductase family 1 member B1-like [Haliotis rubra]
MASIMSYLSMNNGLRMPAVGLGTYLMKGDALKRAVDYALFLGYRHIDTALSYGNEVEVGEVIKDRIRAGKNKRKDLFITTKVPCAYLERDAAIKSAEMSLESLKQTHVDLLLIHQPWGNVNRGVGTLKPLNSKGERELKHHDLLETWSAFEQMHGQNWAKSIGVSNFNPEQIQRIWDKAKIKPANLQLEAHAYWQQKKLVEFCGEKNIILTAYSPLGAPSKPDKKPEDLVLLEDPQVKQLSFEYKKTPGQILLNFLLLKGMGVLPKSQNFERIKDNLDIFDWKLSSSDFEKLLKLDNTVKYFTNEWAHRHPEFDKSEPF